MGERATCDVLVIGGGPAGSTIATQLVRAATADTGGMQSALCGQPACVIAQVVAGLDAGQPVDQAGTAFDQRSGDGLAIGRDARQIEAK